MLPLLGALAGSNAVRIAALVPQIVGSVDDDPRLVEPLWRCLTVAGIEKDPACRTIVERLLVIAMDVDGFEALQRQEPYTRDFLDEAVRRRAYPFEKGLSRTCNLVTLLAWAEHLGMLPPRPNRYYEAKAADRLGRVEVDKRRTIGFSLFWPARVASLACAVGSVVALLAISIVDWRLMLQPIGWLTPLASLALSVLGFSAFLALERIGGRARESSFANQYLRSTNTSEDTAHYGDWIAGITGKDWVAVVAFVGGPVAYLLATPPLFSWNPWAYLFVAILGPLVFFRLPNINLFGRRTRFYPYRPNEFIDMYDDPHSRLWLVRSTDGVSLDQAVREPVAR